MPIPIAAGADADVETCSQLDKGARGVLDFFPDGGGAFLCSFTIMDWALGSVVVGYP